MAADFCRLCLRPIDKAKSTDLVTETTKSAMLKEFLPEMNLDISENTQVCSSCIEELETSYNFKHGVVVNETNIQTKLEENDLKKIDLKLMLDDVAKKEVKTADYVCRTCFSICRTPSISLFDSPTNMMPYSFVKKMCQVVFELEFIAADKPVLCDDCWETLQTVYNFRKCCLRTDKKLRIFVANKNITKVNNDEFKEFAEENPPKDDAEDSSDDELDEYIKEEPVDADEIKFDPDEASCSSSSVKVKKETAVKSESELNSEDEDMEDEPELLDPKTIKSEASELDGEECKMEIGDVKVDAEGEGSAGPSGYLNIGDGHETLQKSKINKFQCTECFRKFQVKQSLARHILFKHSGNIAPMFHCNVCSYATHVKDSMKQHMLVHAAPGTVKVFQCSDCSYESKRKVNLKRRRLCKHSGDSPRLFHCTECQYSTNIKSSLKTHMLTHAAPGTFKIFQCSDCSYQSNRSENLTNHKLVIHSGDRIRRFHCADCPYKTNVKGNLKSHVLVHAAPGTVPLYQCTECSSEFRQKYGLDKHKLLNHPRIFRCTECCYSSNIKDGLQHHMYKQHGHAPPMFCCTECSKQIIGKDNFDKDKLTHIPAGKVSIFHCMMCSYKTKEKGNFRKHFLGHTASDRMKMVISEQWRI